MGGVLVHASVYVCKCMQVCTYAGASLPVASLQPYVLVVTQKRVNSHTHTLTHAHARTNHSVVKLYDTKTGQFRDIGDHGKPAR